MVYQVIITSITVVIIINGISGYYYWVKENTTVHMFNISNVTGISFKQKFFKVGVWQPVQSCCLNLSANAKEPLNRSWRRDRCVEVNESRLCFHPVSQSVSDDDDYGCSCHQSGIVETEASSYLADPDHSNKTCHLKVYMIQLLDRMISITKCLNTLNCFILKLSKGLCFSPND